MIDLILHLVEILDTTGSTGVLMNTRKDHISYTRVTHMLCNLKIKRALIDDRMWIE